jgi:hypothetical protein
MFCEGDSIYIKKYMGNSLDTDTNRIYVIENVIKKVYFKFGNRFEKSAILNNGREQLIYTYNTITKERVFYIEHVPWYKNITCCSYI